MSEYFKMSQVHVFEIEADYVTMTQIIAHLGEQYRDAPRVVFANAELGTGLNHGKIEFSSVDDMAKFKLFWHDRQTPDEFGYKLNAASHQHIWPNAIRSIVISNPPALSAASLSDDGEDGK